MDLINDVLPAKNLPGTSDKWGREVHDNLVVSAVSQQETADQLRNMKRSVGGTAAVTARNIIELNARRMVSQKVPDVTTSVIASAFPAAAVPFSVSADAAIPVPDNRRRKGLATVGVTLNSSNLNVIANITLYIELNGVRVAAIAAQVPQVSSRPKPDWFASNTLTFAFVTDGSEPVITFSVSGTASAISGTQQSFVGITNILTQVSYGPEIS